MSDYPKITAVTIDDLSLLFRMFLTLASDWEVLCAMVRLGQNPNDQDARRQCEKEIARMLQERPEIVGFMEKALKQLEGKQEQLLEFFGTCFPQSASGQE